MVPSPITAFYSTRTQANLVASDNLLYNFWTSDTKENLKLEDAIPVVKTPSSSTKGETQKFSTESKSGPTAHASKGKPPQHDGEKGK
ncbi:hypothetical protein SUGI_1079140 [Cryptomeria japonica]|nr:hypothetical protein SUGI_1079140 [Cryptomeria japonica]